jgi:hypothetical protein
VWADVIVALVLGASGWYVPQGAASQAPPLQNGSVAVHCVAQLPQCSGVSCRFSHPLPQSSNPLKH